MFIVFIDKNVSFLLSPYRSKLHYDLSFTFLHPALNKLLNLPLPIFIVNDDRKVICLHYAPCRYYCTSVGIRLKTSIFPCLCKLSDAFNDPRLVNKLSKLDDVQIGQKLVHIQHTASGNSKLNIETSISLGGSDSDVVLDVEGAGDGDVELTGVF